MFQTIVICGRLGKDPEFKAFGEDKQVCKFVVAVNDGFGHKQRTEWFNCAIWAKKAQIFNDLVQKGTLVFLEGKQMTSEWTDSENKRHFRSEVQVTNFRIISGGKPRPEGEPEPTDEIPF